MRLGAGSANWPTKAAEIERIHHHVAGDGIVMRIGEIRHFAGPLGGIFMHGDQLRGQKQLIGFLQTDHLLS